MRRSSTRSSDRAPFTTAAIVALIAAWVLVGAAAAAPDNEVDARLARANAAIEQGDSASAVAVYRELAEFYLRGGDAISAAAAVGEAARLLIGLDRNAEALSLLDASRVDDPDPDRNAERNHLRVIALERSGRLEEARAALRSSRESVPALAWAKHLRTDAIRLGVTERASGPGSVAWALLLLTIGFAVAWTVWRRRRADIATVGISIFVMLALVEIGVRMFLPPPSEVRHILHPPSRTTVFRPERGVMPGVDYAESRFTISADGLRSDPLPRPGVMRVVAIGGSTTEALYLDDRDAWTAVLQVKLENLLGRPVWVGNAGKSGLSSFAHVSQASAYVEDIKPDVVVVQAGINDLTMCISGDRGALMQAASDFRWRDAWDTYGLGVFAEVRPLGTRSGFRLQRLVDSAFARPNIATVDNGRALIVQDRQASYYRVLRSRRAAATKVDVPPDIGACLIAYEDNLRRIASIVAPLGIKLVLITQGALYRKQMPAEYESLLWFGSVDRSMFDSEPAPRYYSTGVLAEALERYNETTMRVCAEVRALCVDADAILPRTTESYYDDVHMNVQGARVLGMALGVAIARQLDPSGTPTR